MTRTSTRSLTTRRRSFRGERWEDALRSQHGLARQDRLTPDVMRGGDRVSEARLRELGDGLVAELAGRGLAIVHIEGEATARIVVQDYGKAQAARRAKTSVPATPPMAARPGLRLIEGGRA